MPGPGIEPRTTACQADVVTTTLPCLSPHNAMLLMYNHTSLISHARVVGIVNLVACVRGLVGMGVSMQACACICVVRV